MHKYIDSDLAIKDIQETYCKPCKKRGDDYHGVMCRACFSGDCIDVIDRQPEADVQPVVHCKDCWKRDKYGECPRISRSIAFGGTPISYITTFNNKNDDGFCECGAKMDGDEHEKTV